MSADVAIFVKCHSSDLATLAALCTTNCFQIARWAVWVGQCKRVVDQLAVIFFCQGIGVGRMGLVRGGGLGGGWRRAQQGYLAFEGSRAWRHIRLCCSGTPDC